MGKLLTSSAVFVWWHPAPIPHDPTATFENFSISLTLQKLKAWEVGFSDTLANILNAFLGSEFTDKLT